LAHIQGMVVSSMLLICLAIQISILQLWNSFHDPKDIDAVVEESLSKLGTDYLDLYLIHW